MGEFTPNSFWLIGFLLVVAVAVIIVLLHNNAAKTDTVNRSEKDTIENSVSITPPDEKRKID